MEGIGGGQAAELHLQIVLSDGRAGTYRLAPRWECCPDPTGGRAAVVSKEATASLAAPAEVLPAEGPPPPQLVLTVLNAGNVTSVPLVPCKLSLPHGSSSSSISLQIRPSEDRAIVRYFEFIGSQKKWISTGLYTFFTLSSAVHSFSTEQLIGKGTVDFYAPMYEELAFPPFRLNFMADFHSEELGEGNEGNVYRCACHFNQHSCAVKEVVLEIFFIRSTNCEPSDVTLLAKLNHANIIKLYLAWNQRKSSFGRSFDVVFTSMELCARTLMTYLRKNSEFDLGTANYIFRQIITGLDHMHQHHVVHRDLVHRDLKPANILLEDDLTLKICDFGIAEEKESPNSKFNPGVLGSLPYCSPEIGDFEKFHDVKVDIFSAGMIYFETFTPDVTQRESKVDKISRLIRKAIHTREPLTELDLDGALAGSDVLDGWNGDYLILTMMLNPDDLKRPSASEILAMLPDIQCPENFEKN